MVDDGVGPADRLPGVFHHPLLKAPGIRRQALYPKGPPAGHDGLPLRGLKKGEEVRAAGERSGPPGQRRRSQSWSLWQA